MAGFDWGALIGSSISAGVQYNLGNKMTRLEEQRETNRKAEATQKREDALATQAAADAKYQAGVGQIYSGLMEAYGEDEDEDGKLDVVQDDSYYNTNVAANGASNRTRAAKTQKAYQNKMTAEDFTANGGNEGTYEDYLKALKDESENPYKFTSAIDTSKASGIYATFDDEIDYTK